MQFSQWETLFFGAKALLVVRFLGAKWTPKLFPKFLNMELKHLHNCVFFLIFGLRFASMLGAILELNRAMMRQDGPKKDFKSLKVPKSSN